MAGRFGASGYVMLIEILARPELMVFGLVGAMILVAPILKIVHGMFLNSIGSIQADSISGFVTWFFAIIIYVTICLIVMHKIFALIYIIPNSVPRWFGGHASGHDKASEAEHEIKGAAMAGIVAGRSAVSGAFDQRRHKQMINARNKDQDKGQDKGDDTKGSVTPKTGVPDVTGGGEKYRPRQQKQQKTPTTPTVGTPKR